MTKTKFYVEPYWKNGRGYFSVYKLMSSTSTYLTLDGEIQLYGSFEQAETEAKAWAYQLLDEANRRKYFYSQNPQKSVIELDI